MLKKLILGLILTSLTLVPRSTLDYIDLSTVTYITYVEPAPIVEYVHTPYSSDDVREYLKDIESFTKVAKPDYKQHSNGYGTKARYANEVITEVEALRRFNTHVDKVVVKVLNFVPSGTSKGTIDALVSLSYNTGYSWMYNNLGRYVKSNNLTQIKRSFVRYNKVTLTKKGVRVLTTLRGLRKRRLVEVEWIL